MKRDIVQCTNHDYVIFGALGTRPEVPPKNVKGLKEIPADTLSRLVERSTESS